MSLPRIAAIIPSRGRPRELRKTVENVRAQTWGPERLVLSIVGPEDCDLQPGEFPGVEVLFSPKGVSCQLNRALASLALELDYVCFFDDDVVLADDYIERMAGFLVAEPGIVGISGHVLRDGNVTWDEARALVTHPPATPPAFRTTGRQWVLYGCNMVIRRAALAREAFDERFVLYAWMTEVELTYRLLAYGRVGRYSGGRLVHLKTPAGRMSDSRFGYSQVVNRVYVALRPAVASRRWLMMGWALYYSVLYPPFNALSALTRRHDPRIDYAGRLRGNLLGWADLLRGRVTPERIQDLE